MWQPHSNTHRLKWLLTNHKAEHLNNEYYLWSLELKFHNLDLFSFVLKLELPGTPLRSSKLSTELGIHLDTTVETWTLPKSSRTKQLGTFSRIWVTYELWITPFLLLPSFPGLSQTLWNPFWILSGIFSLFYTFWNLRNTWFWIKSGEQDYSTNLILIPKEIPLFLLSPSYNCDSLHIFLWDCILE